MLEEFHFLCTYSLLIVQGTCVASNITAQAAIKEKAAEKETKKTTKKSK